jgi:hypothetical protein
MSDVFLSHKLEALPSQPQAAALNPPFDCSGNSHDSRHIPLQREKRKDQDAGHQPSAKVNENKKDCDIRNFERFDGTSSLAAAYRGSHPPILGFLRLAKVFRVSDGLDQR